MRNVLGKKSWSLKFLTASLYTCGNFTRRVIQVFSIPGSPDRRVRKSQIKYDLLATKAGKIDWNAHPTGAYQPIANENSPSLPNGKHLANGQITRLRSKRFRFLRRSKVLHYPDFAIREKGVCVLAS